MSSLIPTLKTSISPPPSESMPKTKKKTKLAKVMAKTRLGDGEFDLGVLMAKVPGKSLIDEDINEEWDFTQTLAQIIQETNKL